MGGCIYDLMHSSWAPSVPDGWCSWGVEECMQGLQLGLLQLSEVRKAALQLLLQLLRFLQQALTFLWAPHSLCQHQ